MSTILRSFQRSAPGFWAGLQHPRSCLLLSTAITGLAIKLVQNGYLLAGLTALMGLGYLYPDRLLRWGDRLGQGCRDRGWNLTACVALLAGAAVLLLAFLGHVEPASAQFFVKTESWLQTNLKIAADLNKMIFNTLRGVFVVYLAINLVKVMNAAREGEDWQTLARTPLIILVTVTMGDVLAGAITGTGSAG